MVSKLSNDLSTLLASTFLGGNLWDVPSAMELDESGNVVIGGRSASSNYPISAGAYHANYSDPFPGHDGVVTRLSNDLTTLQASTYIGGPGIEVVRGLDVAADGSVYVCGSSDNSSFPVTAGAYCVWRVEPSVGQYLFAGDRCAHLR